MLVLSCSIRAAPRTSALRRGCTETLTQVVPLVGAVAAAGAVDRRDRDQRARRQVTFVINTLSGGMLIPAPCFRRLPHPARHGMPTPAVYIRARRSWCPSCASRLPCSKSTSSCCSTLASRRSRRRLRWRTSQRPDRRREPLLLGPTRSSSRSAASWCRSSSFSTPASRCTAAWRDRHRVLPRHCFAPCSPRHAAWLMGLKDINPACARCSGLAVATIGRAWLQLGATQSVFWC